jgi:drug/metabolite transporter (DMT)-like permease
LSSSARQAFFFLVLGLLAVSQSGNIIRLGQAHPAAIAAWRLLLAVVVLAPLAGRQLVQLTRLTRGEWALLFFTGAVLSAHFLTWIAAVQLTTVANAAIFFSINPVLTALAAYFIFGERLGWTLFLSIGLGLAGVAVIGIGDLTLAGGSPAGDALALLCALLFTVYFLAGKRLRSKLDNRVYVTVVYGSAALFSFICFPFFDLPLVRYNAVTWLCFVLMALAPTLIGHTSFNNALKHFDASRIAAATLVEPLLAGLVAFFAWGERITGPGAAGYLLICLSVLVLAFEGRKAEAVPARMV